MAVTMEQARQWRARFEEESPEAVLRWALSEFHPDIALASSFSMEDIVLIAMMADIRPDARVFALDTGRLHEETYEAAEAVRRRLGVRIEWCFPERAAVEELERSKGLYSFRESLENRHECCRIRKVEPLSRALSGLARLGDGTAQGAGRHAAGPARCGDRRGARGDPQAEPSRRLDGARGEGVRPETGAPRQQAPRHGVPLDRLLPVHAPRRARGGPAGGPVVVGEAGAQGVRAPRKERRRKRPSQQR